MRKHLMLVDDDKNAREGYRMYLSAKGFRVDAFGDGEDALAFAKSLSPDLVVLDCPDPETAIAQLATPLYGFKRGRQTFTRERAVLHRSH